MISFPSRYIKQRGQAQEHQQINGGPSQSIQSRHNYDVPGPQRCDQLGQHRSVGLCPAGDLLNHLVAAGAERLTANVRFGSLVEKGKYPPAKPGALDMGPLKAAGLDPKLHLRGQRTECFLGVPPQQPFNFFCDPWRTNIP